MRIQYRIAMIAFAMAAPLSAQAQQHYDEEQQPPPQQQEQQQPNFAERFATANSTNDGCLTQQQAIDGGMPGIARQFTAIDLENTGCITLGQIRGYWRTQRAQHQAQMQQQPPAPPPPQ